MPFRVAAVGTGNVGRHALTQLITNPDYELTGVWVSSSAKAGRDAGELAGLDVSTGISATTDLDDILAARPDCVVYTAMADNRLPEALEDYRRILAAGVNVVGSSAVFLQYPWQVLPDEMIAPIEEAARSGNASIFVNGIDPGFANDLLPLALAGTCQSVEQIRCMEIVNYDTYDSATVMFDVMGFGKPIDELPMLLQPGVLSLAWGSVVRQLAAGLGIELDAVTETFEREPAPEDFDIAAGHIRKGTAAALRFEVRGIKDGRVAVVLEHVTRLRDDLRPDWPRPAQQGGSYRIEITGEPSYSVDLCLRSRNGDHNHAGLVATAARIVNAIPAVVSAAPGIVTTLGLPVITGKGLYAET
ncbi:dihydrodipicolinate reductase, family protein [Mycolicibacterium hassiacum DSM 44199]|jgi:4-hydroxy-tetrahydrodipicolinate reductase|uniref:Dihydrodipicolinate reductase, family protein n=1 Tax=Mycolicibacterium hassiacum (strain DSM 44199 / CIP 105218 / JCM 12690 / 3849) TaxID=1122247 RepID=K5BAL8_MYCHD|nr:diacylglycerol kinase [Mycolicibacterium hassiacum]EKF22465.1 dihydrodipicolinate reductase, family protein [Mycolicibacterium hassiacum DSM 44199]MBX5484992.1 diacylglycerol kinase [Mycolicibacterium hassiacum]MDA4084866.1 diacylglycerol kinase [Mycolicibacterium hassiacum DSM 44199]VCT91695.1 2,4-diaminopentanoate dehydrogenase [Mycolicibacterium hassiacum DSM 44199]